MELHKESNQREQDRHSDWNPDRGSWNEIPGRWQSVGDERPDGDEYVWHFGSVASYEENSKKVKFSNMFKQQTKTLGRDW